MQCVTSDLLIVLLFVLIGGAVVRTLKCAGILGISATTGDWECGVTLLSGWFGDVLFWCCGVLCRVV
jgi:hypothetical protein